MFAARVLLITFIESFATICVERGIYFYTEKVFNWSDTLNLWLALAFGLAYTGGAIASHKTSARLGERKLISLALLGQLGMHLWLFFQPTATTVWIAATALGLLNGLKWPVIESFMAAGLTPRQTAGAVGRFNLSWAAAVPLSLALVGPILSSEHLRPLLFLTPAILNAVALALIIPLPARPAHLAEDHPERLPAERLDLLESLWAGSRWLMLLSYSTMWVLAALTPGIFKRLGYDVQTATLLAALIDFGRVGAFILFNYYTGWHGKVLPLAASLVGLPAGFLMVLWGANLPLVLAGEIVFGVLAGMTYYADLYYALVVRDAAVDAGGSHEGLIGLGFAAGPAAGLAGTLLVSVGILDSQTLAVAIGVAPVVALCGFGTLRALLDGKRQQAKQKAKS